jgi:invasion protein IalB
LLSHLCVKLVSGNTMFSGTQKLFGGVALILLLATGAADAQTAAQRRAQASIWSVNCAGTTAGLDCRAVQSVRMTASGKVTIALHIVPETKKPVLLVLLPLGFYLPAGASIKFGDHPAKALPLNNCDPAGCLAEYQITEAEIGDMLKGQRVVLTVRGPDKKLISAQVPLSGFPAAYAKIK